MWIISRIIRTALLLVVPLLPLAVFAMATDWMPDSWLRASPRGTVADGDAFVVLAFGLRDNAAGASNEALADWLIQNNPKLLPAIVQEGVYRALKNRESSQPKLKVDGWAKRMPHKDGEDVNTSAACAQAALLLQQAGYKKPVLAAHDLQLRRMVWNFESLGYSDGLIVPEMPETPFDPDSTQHWGTRSRMVWVTEELLWQRPLMRREWWWAAGVGSLMLLGFAWAASRFRP